MNDPLPWFGDGGALAMQLEIALHSLGWQLAALNRLAHLAVRFLRVTAITETA
jgi:hypothetical protein